MLLSSDNVKSVIFSSLSCVAPLGWHHYFVTPWANSIEHEQKFEYLLSSLHDLSLDVETACLLTTVALFSSHGLQPQQLSVNIEELRYEIIKFSSNSIIGFCSSKNRIGVENNFIYETSGLLDCRIPGFDKSTYKHILYSNY